MYSYALPQDLFSLNNILNTSSALSNFWIFMYDYALNNHAFSNSSPNSGWYVIFAHTFKKLFPSVSFPIMNFTIAIAKRAGGYSDL